MERLYRSLGVLEEGLGGKRKISDTTGKQNWPRRGVYFIFEQGEYRLNSNELRVVRIGTHAVSYGSKATLWNRLRTHRGSSNGSGNHRGSIFRLHVGRAISVREPDTSIATWSIGPTADRSTRDLESILERRVSEHIGSMSVLWLKIDDDAGTSSHRAYLERNLIGLLAGNSDEIIDPPSTKWLGQASPDLRIRQSGLWNLQHLNYLYEDQFLDMFDQYVIKTLKE